MKLALPLLSEGMFRSTFEWGRIQSSTDWLIPLAVLVAIAVYVIYTYRRDTAELHGLLSVFLTCLRLTVFVGLLLIYLEPRWRNETDQVQNSRVLLLVDTSLSMALDDADASTSAAGPGRARQVIAAVGRGDFLQQLRRRHDVTVLRFDEHMAAVARFSKLTPGGDPAAESATGPESIDWEQALAPRGISTRLGQALREAIEADPGAPVAGVVVFSDGQQNAGLEPSAVVALARERRVPVYPVGIGSLAQPVNVRVSDLLAPARAYPGDRYAVTGQIQAQGLAGRNVTVELVSRDAEGAAGQPEKIEGTQQLALGGDGEQVTVRFELEPDKVGRRTLRLRVKAPPEDQQANDDQQEVDVEVVDRKTHVLLFAGGPSREYQFLRNQLRRDRSVVVDVLLQSGGEGISQDAHEILAEFPSAIEELFEYDSIVAFDPDWSQLTAAEQDLVNRWVNDQAGGLIVIAGPVNTDHWVQDSRVGNKLRELYPVVFHRRFAVLDDARFGSKEPWPIEFTREGQEAEFLRIEDSAAASDLAWSTFPGVFGHYAVKREKDGATVYARFSDPASADGGRLPPYFVGQDYGSGLVFFLGSGEMWRLRAEEEAYFERFYTKLIRHVTQRRLTRGSHRGILIAGDRYLLGSTVNVGARLTNARLEPLESAQVLLEVGLPDGTLETIRLAADPLRAGYYRGQFTARKEGVYELQLPVPESGDERLSRRIQVKVPDLEREHTVRNDPLLSDLAQKTGGYYYDRLDKALGPSSAVGPLVEALRDQSRTVTVLSAPTPLWDNEWTMWVLCGLLCMEWLVRRLMKLA
ncbi:MAG TPA: vWA domain-containing protein [Pirellulales bacterium]|nr:vWA domain-containing protein [Pirellulales bacterium]